MNEAVELVTAASDPDVNMIFGAIIDDELKDSIKVTVIATGFDQSENAARQSQSQTRVTSGTDSQGEARGHNIRPFGNNAAEDQLDIPTFLRNRGRNQFDK